MTERKMISESALQAYFDGELDNSMIEDVEAWLDQNPLERRNFDEWRTQKEELKVLFDPVLKEDIPPQILRPIKSLEPPWRRNKWLSMAAAIMLFIVGGALGLFLSQSNIVQLPQIAQSHSWSKFASSAVGAHLIFAADKNRPVEISGEQREKLIGWLAKWLDVKIIPPDLSEAGYNLIGGRLLPSGYWPAGQFMYQSADGDRMTLFVAKSKSGTDTSFRFWQKEKVGCYYWTDKKFGFALSGERDQKFLKSMADIVYGHFEKQEL